ncbi:MAG: hypothetical protein H0T76_14735 [Nannocystis sp.]|nr:hypothetical protein [Nannocystis sp.]MBA3547737.1 hypothetical protein [Nannocystis sp.]
MRISRDKLGTLALEWCGVAYICVLLWLVLVAWFPVVLLLPVVGPSVWLVIHFYFVILAPLFALASAVLGLGVAVHGLITRGPMRQALAGLLAAILSGSGLALPAILSGSGLAYLWSWWY